MESSQIMYTGYNAHFVNGPQMFDNYPNQSIIDYGMYQNSKMQQGAVRIAHEDNMSGGYGAGDGYYGGTWMGDMEEKYCAPAIPQSQYSDIAASFPRPLLALGGTDYDFEYSHAAYTSYPNSSTAYSNESSPCLNSYGMPHLSAPQSPIIPTTPPNTMYTVPSNSFYMMPSIYSSAQQYPDAVTAGGYVQPQPSSYEMGFGYAQESEFNSYNHHQEEQDDGPELVGMGLYDDPPELTFSTHSSPELACQASPMLIGRGLVLEQSFGLPEDDEEEEEDEDEDDEECDIAYHSQNMQY